MTVPETVALPEFLRLFLVRHGVTAWNRDLRMQGHADIPLDDEGLEQAQRIARRLAGLSAPPAAVWSSDLSRARQTAEAIAAPLALPVTTTPLLREIMLGEWEGLTQAEIAARGDGELLERYRRDPFHNRPPGGESMDACYARMLSALDAVRAAHPHKEVALVGHGGSLRALLCFAVGAPIPSMGHFFLDNASLSIILERGSPTERFRRLLLVNDTSHLAAP